MVVEPVETLYFDRLNHRPGTAAALPNLQDKEVSVKNEQQPPAPDKGLEEATASEAAQELRVGVVGIGWAGQQHLKAYHSLEGVRIVALAGMEQELRDALQAEYSIPNAFADWEDML
jgi:hypothetical protein